MKKSSAIDKRLNLFPMPMHHHASASGYDRVADYLEASVVPPIEKTHIAQRLLGQVGVQVSKRSGSKWYHRDSFVRELYAARQWYRVEGEVFHFLYGENCFRYLGRLKRFLPKRNALVATYHTPPERFNEVVTDKAHIQDLDAVILMSTSQRGEFEKLLDPDRIHFVPHGIDTQYFTPGGDEQSSTRPRVDTNKFDRLRQDQAAPFNCLSVGRMLRDYDTLAAAARILEKTHPRVHFQIVAGDGVQEPFRGLSNVSFFSGIDDEDLLSLYRDAAILTLPMQDCTANNVLLEGMACGLPVVATDLQGVRDYTDATCARLVPALNAPALASAVVRLTQNIDDLQGLSVASRAQAESLAWPKIGDKLREIYASLL